MKKSTLVVLVFSVLVISIVATYFTANYLLLKGYEPQRFHFVLIKGGPSEGIYAVTFALLDNNQKNGPADGTVMLKVYDIRGNLLYQTTRQVNASEFVENTGSDIPGGKALTYSWTFPADYVLPGIPNTMKEGYATVTFATSRGNIFSYGNITVKIPTVSEVKISGVSIQSPLSFQFGYNQDLTANPHYVGDEITIALQLLPQSCMVLKGISCNTFGFSVKGISKTLPLTIDGPTSITVTLSAPPFAYEGTLDLSLQTEECPTGAILTYDRYIFNSATRTLTVYIYNMGSGPATVQNIYISGVAASSLTGDLTIRPGETKQVIAVASQSIHSGVGYTVRVVCYGGTILEFSAVAS